MTVVGLAELAMVALLWAPPAEPLSCPDGLDGDLDGLVDSCELELGARFAPTLLASPAACNWDPAGERLRGGYMFGVEPVPSGLRLVYLPAYLEDCGWSGPKCWLRWRGGCDPHVGDSEFIAIDLRQDSSGAGWRPERVFLSAHCFGRGDDCRWHEASELEWLGDTPLVWVAEGKNANYPSRSACDSGHWHYDTCDRHDRSYRFPVVSDSQNIGSARVPFPGHPEEPGCVVARELPHLPALSGRECVWSDGAFRAWSERAAEGVTGYVRYLREIAELLPTR